MARQAGGLRAAHPALVVAALCAGVAGATTARPLYAYPFDFKLTNNGTAAGPDLEPEVEAYTVTSADYETDPQSGTGAYRCSAGNGLTSVDVLDQVINNNARTISLWFRPQDAVAGHGILGMGPPRGATDPSAPEFFDLAVQAPSSFGVHLSEDQSLSYTHPSGVAAVAIWTHLLVTYDNSSSKVTMYVDGASPFSFNVSAGLQTGFNTLVVCSSRVLNDGGSGLNFEASIDDLAIWSEALSGGNVWLLYQQAADMIPAFLAVYEGECMPLYLVSAFTQCTTEFIGCGPYWNITGADSVTGRVCGNLQETQFSAAMQDISIRGTTLEISITAELTGTVPTEFGLIENLDTLVLAGNYLTGSIPPQLASASFLTKLDLSGNLLSGSVPLSLGQLKELRALDVSGNALSGTLPRKALNSSALVSLDLSDNSFSGTLPKNAWSRLSALEDLNVAANAITGTVPAQLGGLTALTSVQLQGNSLSGTLPSLSFLANLETLNAEDNSLTGTLPGVLLSSFSIQTLRLADNQFSGSLLGFISSIPTGMRYLDFSRNELTGTVPAPGGITFASLHTLLGSGQAGGGLTGSLPTELGLLASLTHVDFSDNALSGTIPTVRAARRASHEDPVAVAPGSAPPPRAGRVPLNPPTPARRGGAARAPIARRRSSSARACSTCSRCRATA